ncbi:hypothetical protein ACFLY7_01930, partial [Patescibacteria group bacterium]
SGVCFVKKGEHQILISKENHWPWSANTLIKSKNTTIINPFFTKQTPDIELITNLNPEYTKISSLFVKDLISQKAQEKVAEHYITFESEVKALDFYKDRDDVVVIALENGIYALELTVSENPNFQPIYLGQNPVFVKKDSKSLYIKDSETISLYFYENS